MLESGPPDWPTLTKHFMREGNITGASVDRGCFRVYSDWRSHADGFGRVLVHGMPNDGMPNRRTAAGKVLNHAAEHDHEHARRVSQQTQSNHSNQVLQRVVELDKY